MRAAPPGPARQRRALLQGLGVLGVAPLAALRLSPLVALRGSPLVTLRGSPLFALRSSPLVAAVGLPLAGCRSGSGDEAASGPGSAGLPEAPVAEVERQGPWQGGPEPVSGKLRSGIVSWWRLAPETPQPGEAFELSLRLESIQAPDAQLSLTASDGARIVGPQAPLQWALRPGRDALVRLRLVAPPGDSYLHVQTRQNGRSSVRSIRLALPGVGAGAGPAGAGAGAGPSSAGAGAAPAPPGRAYELDARGQPVVRMPARPASG